MRSLMFYRCISFILRVRRQMPNLKGLCSKIFLCHWKVRHASSITRCYKCSLRRNVRVPRASSQYDGWYMYGSLQHRSHNKNPKMLHSPHITHLALTICIFTRKAFLFCFVFFNMLTCCKTLTFASTYKLTLFC